MNGRGNMIINRRTFALMATAGALCVSARRVFASTTGPFIAPDEADRLRAVASLQSAPEKITERFPLSSEEYAKVGSAYLPQLVSYSTSEPPGTIIVDTDNRFLYFVLGSNLAKRYGVGVGREGFGWSGTATIRRKVEWPAWFPPKQMIARDREAARWRKGMPGGPRNPLGARAFYLFQGEADTLYRIHGTRDPKSIGKAVSSGCIRMLNADVVELFDRVPLGTRVIVLRSTQPTAQKPQKKARTRVAQARRRRRMRVAAYRRYRRRMFSLSDLFGF
jgi:lipoprotein-anchoring transpeptidase ErfK/SrfK